MARIRALPFPTAAPERIELTGWYRTDGASPEPLPDALPDWDPAASFRARVTLVVAADDLARDCELNLDSVIRVALLWRSRGGTELRGRGGHADLRCDRGLQEVRLDINVPGELLASSLELSVAATTTSTSSPSGSLAATRPGAILWSQSRTVRLEGSASRFPMEWADFPASAALPDRAAWYLSWNRELTEPLGGAVRLYLNRAHPLLSRIADGSAWSDTEVLVNDMLFFDVGRALIKGALSDPEFAHDAERYADDSVGGAVRRLLNLHFPDEAIDSLAGQLQRDPALFDARLQERLRFLARVD